jgi:ADP-ribose pyrophosphatase
METPISVESPFAGRLFKVQVLTWNDQHGREVRREIVQHPGAVLIIPVIDETRLVMIQNFRVAVGERLLEFPAGKLEPGELPANAAARELEEETGYLAANIEKIGEYYTSPGFTNERMHSYAATGLTQFAQRLEAGEEIQTTIVTIQQALSMIQSGEIRDGKSIAALYMWLQRVGRLSLKETFHERQRLTAASIAANGDSIS